MLCFEIQLFQHTLINLFYISFNENAEQLAAIAIGDAFSKIASLAVIKYINIGLQNMCTQAYSVKNHQLIGIYYQRGLLVTLLFCVLITPFFYVSQHLLLLLGFAPQLAKDASHYMWVSLPSLYAFGFYETTKSYLQAQDIFYPQLFIQIIAVVIHFFLAEFFIIFLDFGIEGAAWTRNMSDLALCILIYIYLRIVQPRKNSWIEWNIAAFDRLRSFIKTVFLNGTSGYLEELALYVMTILVGYLSSDISV